MKPLNKKTLKKTAAEEALCSLYRFDKKMEGRTPLDVVAAMGALEHLLLSDRSTKARIKKFKTKLAAMGQ
jgi:hypothetical protein